MILAATLGAGLLIGCGGSSSTPSPVTPPAPVGAATPTVAVAIGGPGGDVTTASALTATVTVASSTGVPSGSVVVTSGSFGSFPVVLVNGVAAVSVPAGLLATGTDTLTANFTSATPATYANASGTASVTVTSSGVALPVVTAVSATCSDMAGSPFRAIPLPSGNVVVAVTAPNSGIQTFTPSSTASCGYQFSCFNALPAQALTDGSTGLGINVLPNGLGLAASIGTDGAAFYNLANLQICKALTPVQVSQGPVAAGEGSFDTVVTPDGKYAFVANEYGVPAGSALAGNVGVVSLQYDGSGNVTGGTLLGQIATGAQYIAGVTLSPDGSRLYVTSEIAPTALVAASAGASNAVLAKNELRAECGHRAAEQWAAYGDQRGGGGDYAECVSDCGCRERGLLAGAYGGDGRPFDLVGFGSRR